MEALVAGVRRFQTEVFPALRERYEELLREHRPRALFVACSDARVSPTVLTQAGPGELFVMRNAGNVVPPPGAGPGGEAATIEYAVRVLGVMHVVVCGHYACGAVQALFDAEQRLSLHEVERWLNHARGIRERVERSLAAADDEARLDRAVEENVRVQVDHLLQHPCVARAVSEERLQVHGWVYRFATAEVLRRDAATDAFVPLV